MFKKSFPPIIAHDPRVLILGSLPGDRSLIENQYYAHPQNRFWPMMTAFLNGNHDANYNERVDLLQKNGICLWDVCKSAKRAGSMDTDILQEVPNDIALLLDQYPSISSILFNGQKAQQLFDRHHRRRTDIH
ncbi:MAG: DNA-deoxyinosine glycosylase, partial [Sphingobacterium sp.]